MSGIIHPYYTVQLAPAVAAVIGIAGVQLWRHRSRPAVRAVLVSALLVTAVWSFVLLSSSPGWLPWLRWTVLAVGILSAALIAAGPARTGRAGVAAATLALLSAGLGTGAWTIATAATGHTGAIPSSGPASATNNQTMGLAGISSPNGADSRGGAARGRPDFRAPANLQPGAAPGGFADAPSDPALNALLQKETTTWSAATVGANSAAALELGSNTSVMAIGGFMGSDPFPTLDQFKQMVSAGQIAYFIPGSPFGGGPRGPGMPAGSGGAESQDSGPGAGAGSNGGPDGRTPPGGGGTSSAITQWVQATFPPTTVGGSTVYQLRK